MAKHMDRRTRSSFEQQGCFEQQGWTNTRIAALMGGRRDAGAPVLHAPLCRRCGKVAAAAPSEGGR